MLMPETFSREKVACVICGEDHDRYLYHAPERIVQCQKCGLVYVNPRLDHASLKKIYTKDYFIVDTDKAGVDYKAYANYIADEPVIMKSMARRTKLVEKYAPGKGKLLDVGCAAGFSLLAAQERGWEAEGIEFSDYCVDYARSRSLAVHHGSLDEYQGGAETCDAITMWDYLEHSVHPVNDLLKCCMLLKKGGVLMLSIPNVDSWSYYVFKDKWIGYKNIEHFYFFSRKTMRLLAAKSGFTMVDSFYHGKYVALSYFLSRIQYYVKFKPVLVFIEKIANIPMLRKVSFYINPYDIINVALRKN